MDEYEEQEEDLPTQEELEYLELRQKLKESFRNKMKKDSSSGVADTRCDDFGSFFGPSRPVIAQRVIQESKSMLVARVSKANNGRRHKVGASMPVPRVSKANNGRDKVGPVVSKPKAKFQMLKDSRDYSFLLSGDAELPVPAPKHPSQRAPPTSTVRKVINGCQERKPNYTSLESRKQLVRSDHASVPGRPKPLPSKIPVSSKEKLISASINTKRPVPAVSKQLHSKPPPVVQEKRLQEKKRDDRASSKGNMMTKKPPVLSSKPQAKQQAKLPTSTQPKERSRKRPVRSYSDDEADHDDYRAAISMIRSMFRYNPNRYRGVDDDDDSDMEAGFDDIMKEERISSRIAAKEDEEELRKIEKYERRERLRKEAKKQKLNQGRQWKTNCNKLEISLG